ncbi:MAG: transcription antitermination factor NusB [Candidatus Roizmanbacteria bacterium]
MDPRHKKRMEIVQELFASSYGVPEEKVDETTTQILSQAKEIDLKIDEFATTHQSDKIAKVDLCILRLAVYELLYKKDVPVKVIINEAVDLAKEFAGEKSPGFVNAVLGGVYEKYGASKNKD